MLDDWPFYLFGILAIAGAVGVLIFKNIMNAAFSLMFCLITLAALYIYGGAHFLGATQLLVYAGGIVVILIFGIMLSRVKDEPLHFSRKFIAFLISAGLSLLLISMIYSINWLPSVPAEFSATHVQDIGISFFTDHLLSFELAGLLLLIALVGAIGIASSRR